MITDPVCNMQVDEKTAAGQSSHEGKSYYFCSSHCKEAFDKNPGIYLNVEKNDHDSHHSHHH